jgi:hypothetical protein
MDQEKIKEQLELVENNIRELREPARRLKELEASREKLKQQLKAAKEKGRAVERFSIKCPYLGCGEVQDVLLSDRKALANQPCRECNGLIVYSFFGGKKLAVMTVEDWKEAKKKGKKKKV